MDINSRLIGCIYAYYNAKGKKWKNVNVYMRAGDYKVFRVIYIYTYLCT